MTQHGRAHGQFERAGIAIAALVGSFIGAAGGQEVDSLIIEVGECVALEAPGSRFDCYEARVEAARSKRRAEPATTGGAGVEPLRPVTAPQTRVVAIEGAAEPAPPIAAERRARRVQDRPPPQELTATITALRETVPNAWLITLDNGQVWRQMRPDPYPIKAGDQVSLRSTNWGVGFRLTVDGRNGFIQVERVR